LSDGIANAEQLLELADKAVYRAKESGRNRTVFCRSELEMDDVMPVE
jgi:PleD family two-component response regulator